MLSFNGKQNGNYYNFEGQGDLVSMENTKKTTIILRLQALGAEGLIKWVSNS